MIKIMMTITDEEYGRRVALARKALDKVGADFFQFDVWASEGGHCGGGCNIDTEIFMDDGDIRYLIKAAVREDEVFEGLEVAQSDPDEKVSSEAYECAWPDGGPVARFHSCLPDELSDLADKIFCVNVYDDAALDAVRKAVSQIADGTYTFTCDVVDGPGDYYFTEGADVKFQLTADEARGLLWGATDVDRVFDGICKRRLETDFLDEKADKENIAEGYDCFSYGGSSEDLEAYVQGWADLVDMIMDGSIYENELEDILEFFRGDAYRDQQLEDWLRDDEDIRKARVLAAAERGDYSVEISGPNNVEERTRKDGSVYYIVLDRDEVRSSNDAGSCVVEIAGETFECNLNSGEWSSSIDEAVDDEDLMDVIMSLDGVIYGEHRTTDDYICVYEAANGCKCEEYYFYEDCPSEEDEEDE